uniref:NAD(P)-binding domain-containing protein n=1 Tax=Glycine max TaxID=3847 RepID=A0A0R0HGM8_SOYBN
MAPSFDISTHTICVMDASGHLGFSLVQRLLQRGYTIHASVKKYGEENLFNGISSDPDKLKVFRSDPFDYHSIIDALRGCSDLCDWNGVSCTATRDHVIKLILHGNSLVGVIPKELGMLKSLKVLDLGINHLIGPIPPEIGNLTQNCRLLNYFDGVVFSIPLHSCINLQSNGLTGMPRV